MMDPQRPDFIVGIDVGMTCTGVAYANLMDQEFSPPEVKLICEWAYVLDKDCKVPTQVVYARDDIQHGPVAWGFGSEARLKLADDTVSGHWFKQRFCPSSRSKMKAHADEPIDPNLPSVDTLYEDFLAKVYGHIRGEIENRELVKHNREWESCSINFLFSVPATWDSTSVEHFKTLAAKAGFGREPGHSVAASLTEPEAVVIFTIQEEQIEFENGDNILIVDAGGGTTDLCLVKIDKQDRNMVSLAELGPVVGEDAGAAYIDSAFQDLVLEALSKGGRERLTSPPETVAWEMMRSSVFQDWKHSLGVTNSRKGDALMLKIPGLGDRDTSTESNIVRGRMSIERSQLARVFDEQVEEIAKMVDRLVEHMEIRRLGQLNYIILSGGLGSSPYIQNKLKARYGARSSQKMLENLVFHLSKEPRLCVCKGLVHDRLHHLYTGSSTFTRLCSQFSFGILKDEGYDHRKAHHQAAKREKKLKTLVGSKRLVGDCAKWLIKRRFAKNLHHRFESSVPRWGLVGQVTIVSSIESEPPAYFAPDNGVKKVKVLHCDYSRVEVRERPWYRLRSNYQQVDFKIEATVGATEAIFNCLSLDDGLKLSRQPVRIPAQAEAMERGCTQAALFG
ncbi:hypothetical protein GGR52DRAFT_591069 [Hypoxylon sp. FL1284]|nr:hypothetical protein GGR52DRAFT_591069 [Hypoxylon sp. FL1284]